jgi:cytoskeleton protein RodZ
MPQQNELLPATPGELLGNARRRQRRSISEVAKYLRLGVDKIEAMEADQWEQIAPAYCKGFARRYANFLKLPAESFETALTGIACEEVPVQSVFSKSNSEKISSLKSFRVLTYLVATVFIVLPLVLAYTHFVVRWSQDEPLLVNSQPDSAGLANSQLAHLQANMLPATMLSAATNQAVIKVDRLDIELSADSWLSITDAEGRQLESDLRKGGQVYSYQGKPPFQLQVGRVSAARVRLNGELVDLDSFTTGDVASLEVGEAIQE